MVRKRSRTSRKHYDEDNDSDSDFALDEPPSQPAQKKYSLRQRKRRLFTEFEFNDDGEEVEPTRVPSDDDDFEVERELELNEAPDTQYVNKETYINHYEPENEDLPEDADGLIDFEDMIRADIVVNKNRIDYDNIIQKTLIKVQPIEETVEPVVKAKRGRKPKARPEGEIDSSLLEPETEMQEVEFEDKTDKDYIPDDDIENEELIDCAKLMHAELSESANELTSTIPTMDTNVEQNLSNDTLEENVLTKPVEVKPVEVKPDEVKLDEVKPDKVFEITNVAEDSVEKVNESNLLDMNQDKVDVNGKTSPVRSVDTNNLISVDEKISKISKPHVIDIDDDDVVLVEDEKKCEVIVLDD